MARHDRRDLSLERHVHRADAQDVAGHCLCAVEEAVPIPHAIQRTAREADGVAGRPSQRRHRAGGEVDVIDQVRKRRRGKAAPDVQVALVSGERDRVRERNEAGNRVRDRHHDRGGRRVRAQHDPPSEPGQRIGVVDVSIRGDYEIVRCQDTLLDPKRVHLLASGSVDDEDLAVDRGDSVQPGRRRRGQVERDSTNAAGRSTRAGEHDSASRRRGRECVGVVNVAGRAAREDDETDGPDTKRAQVHGASGRDYTGGA